MTAAPVRYIDKSRAYYAALGYETPYRWAAHDEVPFTPLSRSLVDARVGLVTTSARSADDRRDPYAEPIDPPPASMATSHLQWHQAATHTRDLGSFLPIEHLANMVEAGLIGSLSDRFYGMPTNYSHRLTLEWSERIVGWAREDEIDLMILVPL